MKVAWLCLQGLGDTLMATPAISALKAAKPDWDIHAVSSQDNCHELLRRHPAITKAHQFRFWSLGARALIEDLPNLRAERFDATILAYPATRNEYHILSFLIGGKRRISHRYASSRLACNLLETTCIDIAPGHNVQNNMRLLEALDAGVQDVPAFYTIPPDWSQSGPRTDTIAFHIGSMTYKGNELKRWPPSKYIELGRLMKSRGHAIAYIAGPNEMAETQKVRDAVDPQADLIRGDVATVARRLASLAAVVAGDNGIAHLAAAVNTPVLTLFGPTDPEKCRPWGPRVTALRPSDCPPCFEFSDDRFVCKRNIGARCINSDLTVSAALSALESLLENENYPISTR